MSPAPSPVLALYGRPGCHLCEETGGLVERLLADRTSAGRPTARLAHRDIETDPTWERAYLTTIPVLELGDRRLGLAIGAAKVRAFLDEVLG